MILYNLWSGNLIIYPVHGSKRLVPFVFAAVVGIGVVGIVVVVVGKGVVISVPLIIHVKRYGVC